MAISKLKNGKATGKIKFWPNWLKVRGGKAQEGHLWTYLKNIEGRDHTTWVKIWHDMSNSKERGWDDMR
jgi:hypothetical protein